MEPGWRDLLPAPRLLAAAATSLALHGFAAFLLAFLAPHYRQIRSHPQPVLAYLRPAPETPVVEPLTPSSEEPLESAPIATGKAESSDTNAKPLSQPARFAAPPNFEPLESLPTTLPARLRVRIHVSALGRLQRVEIVENQRVPPDFLASVFEQLEPMEYVPGVAEGRPVDSSFELLIVANPVSGSTGNATPPQPQPPATGEAIQAK